jgi:hypothetical protein
MKRAVLWVAVVGLFCHWGIAQEPKVAAAENLIIVTLDGLRWQEVFGGFDPLLATKEAGGLTDLTLPRVHREFARPSAEESRATILPFFWEVVAKKGQVLGIGA